MFIDGQDIAFAFGLMLFMEGLLYVVLPHEWVKTAFAYIMNLPVERFRLVALIAASIGMIIMWSVGTQTELNKGM